MSDYDEFVRVDAIPDYGRDPLDGISVLVSGVRLTVSEEATVEHVLRALDAARDYSKKRKRYLRPSYAVLVRDDDVNPGGDADELPPPDDDEIVPGDLSTLEPGDVVHVYRLPEDRRPGYPELVAEQEGSA